MADEVPAMVRMDPLVPRYQARRSKSKLSPRWRKLLMVVHLIVAVGLLGSDLAVLVLVTSGWRGAEPVTVYPAAHLISVVVLVPFALLAVATGLLQGLLTPWGLLKHWWVTIKLLLTIAGTVLALRVLTPSLAGAEQAALAGMGVPSVGKIGLVRASSAASVVLTVTVVLSVYKPFGRLLGRKSRTK